MLVWHDPGASEVRALIPLVFVRFYLKHSLSDLRNLIQL